MNATFTDSNGDVWEYAETEGPQPHQVMIRRTDGAASFQFHPDGTTTITGKIPMDVTYWAIGKLFGVQVSVERLREQEEGKP